MSVLTEVDKRQIVYVYCLKYFAFVQVRSLFDCCFYKFCL